ncbi:MAG: ribose 5-phosphate isomerase B [Candidatus Eisenbacteria bacterium]|uniref:Ribose 5-phosphate isomerase B n=1 Tax=Eiseniibacteriota bacterium TaxID=2212470 RepID=A0A938BPV0_UNCEI|nr:ribose 5-phosphate isomerase B [Candidatus Eisenbacteria bacterium]
MSAFRVLFVCTGNTCRSPLAEGLLRHMLAQAGGEGGRAIEVSSAGVAASEGERATASSLAVAAERGLDLGGHRARRLTPDLLAGQDLVLALSAEHCRAALGLDPEARGRVFTLTEYAGGVGRRGIPDPLGSDLETYRSVRDRIEGELRLALPRLLEAGAAGSRDLPAIEIGCDHRGFALKERIVRLLEARGHRLQDWGCPGTASCDYPEYAFAVARAVAGSPGHRGILICSTGVGMAMAANKVPGARAALCLTPAMAAQSRRHNDANVLALGADNLPEEESLRILDAWLEARFEGGRHARRVAMMTAQECRGAGPAEGPPGGGRDGQ